MISHLKAYIKIKDHAHSCLVYANYSCQKLIYETIEMECKCGFC